MGSHPIKCPSSPSFTVLEIFQPSGSVAEELLIPMPDPGIMVRDRPDTA
jgi:hypothetical protein